MDKQFAQFHKREREIHVLLTQWPGLRRRWTGRRQSPWTSAPETDQTLVTHYSLATFMDRTLLTQGETYSALNFVNIGLESGELVHAIGKFLVDHATTSVFSNKAQGRGGGGHAMAAPTTATHLSRSFAWLLPTVWPTSAIWADKAAGWKWVASRWSISRLSMAIDLAPSPYLHEGRYGEIFITKVWLQLRQGAGQVSRILTTSEFPAVNLKK